MIARELYATILRVLPSSWLETLRHNYAHAPPQSRRRSVLGRVLGILQYRRLDPKTSEFTLLDDSSVRIANVRSVIVRRLYWFGRSGYEAPESEYWQWACRSASTILEIGANIGFYTIIGAKAAPEARYIAIEPHPRTAAVLRRNLALNRIGNVEVIEAAVTWRAVSKTGLLKVPLGDWDSTPAGAFLCSKLNVGKVCKEGIEVAVVGADSLPYDIDLIKMDAEGSEFEILSGLVPLIRARRPMIFLELLRDTADLRSLARELCEELGYHAYAIGTSKLSVLHPESLQRLSHKIRFAPRDIILSMDELPLCHTEWLDRLDPSPSGTDHGPVPPDARSVVSEP